MTRQVEAHHFCGHQNEEFRQCLIYDRPDADGRLIGLEYIISEPIFLTLPDSEKPFWHSHEYEVKGGYLFMPGVPSRIQWQDLKNVCKTYGKVFHFWQVDRGDSLPLGIPQVMMALTRDGQLYENLAQGIYFLTCLSLSLYIDIDILLHPISYKVRLPYNDIVSFRFKWSILFLDTFSKVSMLFHIVITLYCYNLILILV